MAVAAKEQFFERLDYEGLALTYDDVRLQTRSSQFKPLDDIDISSRFSEHIEVKVPIISAAMDTVTLSPMAIEIGKLGGLGVINAAMSIYDQRQEVRRVKKASHNLIDTPITVQESDTLLSVLNMCKERRFDFRTFPVLNSDGKVTGILSAKDFEYPESLDIPVATAMTPSEYIHSAPAGTGLREAYDIMQSRKIKTLPLINEDGTIGGLYLWSDVKRNIREADQYNVDQNGQLIAAAAVSTGEDTLERVDALSKYTDVFVIDTANGDAFYAFETLKAIKRNFKEVEVVVGNISDGPSALELAQAGANGIKVGQGPGSICTTRRELGIGKPQVSAIYDCVRHLNGDKKYKHIPVCADGGIKDHGDISIAFAAGAHTVMLGKMLAGTAEAPGNVVTLDNGSRVKQYRGMGSASALKDNEASRERYGANNGGEVILPQGIEAIVPFEGSVKDVLGLCVAALKDSMKDVKAPDIEYHRENSLLMRITVSGLRESHPHDVKAIR
jgi:IMP dehydrogenase